ncbi:outer membrane protein assembly factor BamA [Candidatus Pelagibacter sp.]|nr:outer membrane protein assembly factor BamA [Candidatus Pelagibacter sp.]
MFKSLFLIPLFFLLLIRPVHSEKINQIQVIGNDRISNETIILFGGINLDEDYDDNKINLILKKLYDTNFFKNVSLKLTNKILIISVEENPIIQSIDINGIKAKKLREPILETLVLKDNNSFIEYLAKQDKVKILNLLKNSGYYFAEVKLNIINNSNKTVSLIYDIDLGKKAKIRKIKFIGDKKFKDRKLYNVIVSEENRFWKFLSSRKLLNQERINLDSRLLEGFYKNKGYYNVKIQSSFAKFLDEGKFDLIFNINAGQKFFFNDLNLILPKDYSENNFVKINSILSKIKGKHYSYNNIEKILKEVEKIALIEQYESINATVEENIVDNNKLNFSIYIDEVDKEFIERINILGNNITREEVLRNQLVLDEGDAFNKILHSKNINNLKSLNFFKEVTSEIVEGSTEASKIINISVVEKPTGEISAGVGVGTSGGTIGVAVKENNFLGKGIEFATSLELTKETIRGNFDVVNPNFRGSDQSIMFGLQSSETDRMTQFGYKTNKTGFHLGSRFEYYEDFYISPNLTTYYETLKTASSASANLRKQKGNYFDTDFDYFIDYDKRNQKFQTTEGFRGRFNQSIPIISETNSLINGFEFNSYHQLLDGMIGSINFYSKAINSISGDDVRISERLYMPTRKLRGFERGKIGPVDNNDYVGGNYVSSLNFSATLPKTIPSIQNADLSIFFDAGNVWGVDYSSAIDESNKIRSSVGLAVDWYTVIGPLSFSYAGTLTKASTDKVENFRFNIGTTF